MDINGLIGWDVGEVYSELFGVDVGGNDEGICCCEESVNWSDKWEISSVELFAWNIEENFLRLN